MRDDAFDSSGDAALVGGKANDAHRLLDCDLVMKGGITSGVVYPKAVVRLARDYRINNVGGTSIGAIAAALTAAAEYFRRVHPDIDAQQWPGLDAAMAADLDLPTPPASPERTGAEMPSASSPGFAGLYAIPKEIGSDLLAKFRPQPLTRGAFNYVVGVMWWGNFPGKLAAALIGGFPVFRIVVAMIVCLVALTFARDPDTAVQFAVLALAGLVLLLVVPFLLRVRTDVRPTPAASGTDKPKNWFRIALITAVAAIVAFGISMAVRRILDLYDRDASFLGDYFAPIPGFWDQFAKVQRTLWSNLWDLRHVSSVDDLRNRARDGAQGNKTWLGAAILGLLAGWVLGGAVALVAYFGFAIRWNFLGLCTGLGNDDTLTNWLASKINVVAGLPKNVSDASTQVLTCEMLTKAGITFEAITSDLTRGVPLDVPRALENYGFVPDEFRHFFPKAVLAALGVTDPKSKTPMPFGSAESLPVVVVARTSMSFPVLFSAIPVYDLREVKPRRCWLSDGGVVSNFPVHKFDRALPPWPTFAFDLLPKTGPKPASLTERVSLVRIQDGIPPRPQQVAMRDLAGLASGILNTARGWMDNSQKTLPGYAERIVGVHLYPGEGGLNLNMTEDTIVELANRGLVGADLLARLWAPFGQNSTPDPQSQWHQHRWLRYRILMRELEELAREWTWIYNPDAPNVKHVHVPTLQTLVEQAIAADDRPEHIRYRWQSKASAGSAKRLSDLFVAFANLAANKPGDAVDRSAESGAEANVDPAVFDQPHAPSPNPKLFMIPPFE